MMMGDIGELLLFPVVLLSLAFWVWMIIDCVKREGEGSTGIAWLLVILFTGPIGAPLYFLFASYHAARTRDIELPHQFISPGIKMRGFGELLFKCPKANDCALALDTI
jgi:hypothetical protein